jgi:pimeloyl-ACP methyl ester carboxylesterase
MPYATNALDGSRVYFEDDGGDGTPVVLHGGIIDSVDLVRESNIAQALQELPRDEFRLIYVAHRGVGGSDKPHEVEAYAMPLRVADAVAVLDELGIERAHFIGNSWGGKTRLRDRRTCARARALARDRRPAALCHRP